MRLAMSKDNSKQEMSLDFLKSHALFSGLSEAALMKCLSMGKDAVFPNGAKVFAEGDPGDSFYLILQGRVEVLKKVPVNDGVSHERIAVLDRGETFGEMSIIDALDRSATIHAIEETFVLKFSQDDIQKLFETDPHTYAAVLLNLSRQISQKLRMVDSRFAIALFVDRDTVTRSSI